MEVRSTTSSIRCSQLNPSLGPVYPGKVDLANAYMRLQVKMEDVPSVVFLIPNKAPSNQQLVGSHLSLPMAYIDMEPYFYMDTKTVANFSNREIAQ